MNGAICYAPPGMKPKFKVWVTFGERTKFGEGRAQLLERIDQLGSISQAVVDFGMSYRTAWGYIRELEAAAGFELLHRTPGRGARSGTRLTEGGRRFLDRYRRFHAALERAVQREFALAFGPGREPRRSSRRTRRSS